MLSDSNKFEPRTIKLYSQCKEFGFHIKGPKEDGGQMLYLNGQLYPPLNHISSLSSNGIAMKSGLSIFDVILFVNNHNVKGLSQVKVEKYIKESCDLEIVVMRPNDIKVVRQFTDSNSFERFFSSEKISSLTKMNTDQIMIENIKSDDQVIYTKDPRKNFKTFHDHVFIPCIHFRILDNNECAFFDIYYDDNYLISRRFNDFDLFDKYMKQNYSDLPQFPSKWNLFINNQKLEERRQQLEKYIKLITESEIIMRIKVVRFFLGLVTNSDHFYSEELKLCNYEQQDQVHMVMSKSTGFNKKIEDCSIAKDSLVESLKIEAEKNLQNTDTREGKKILIPIGMSHHEKFKFKQKCVSIVIQKFYNASMAYEALCCCINLPASLTSYFSLFYCESENSDYKIDDGDMIFDLFIKSYAKNKSLYGIIIKRWIYDEKMEEQLFSNSWCLDILYCQFITNVENKLVNGIYKSCLRLEDVSEKEKRRFLMDGHKKPSYGDFNIFIEQFEFNEINYQNVFLILGKSNMKIVQSNFMEKNKIEFPLSAIKSVDYDLKNNNYEPRLKITLNDMADGSKVIIIDSKKIEFIRKSLIALKNNSF